MDVTIEDWKSAPDQKKDQIRQQLIERYSSLIKLVACRIIRRLPPQVELGDLINSGVLGLMDAIEKFDTGREIKFETYAEFRIRGAILDELRGQDWVPRSIRQRIHEMDRANESLENEHGRPATDEEIAARMNITLDDLFDLINKANGCSLISLDDLGYTKSGTQRSNLLEYFKHADSESVIDMLELQQIRDTVAASIEDLPKNERFVVSMYYFDELTMKEIGLAMGITESRISQIHNKAMSRLRGKLKRSMEN